eukprot:10133201-Ditylum_brightwellii.AAC.1
MEELYHPVPMVTVGTSSGGTDIKYGGCIVLKRGGKFIMIVGPREAIGHTYEMAGGMPPIKEENFIRAVVNIEVQPEIILEVSWGEDALREVVWK